MWSAHAHTLNDRNHNHNNHHNHNNPLSRLGVRVAWLVKLRVSQSLVQTLRRTIILLVKGRSPMPRLPYHEDCFLTEGTRVARQSGAGRSVSAELASCALMGGWVAAVAVAWGGEGAGRDGRRFLGAVLRCGRPAVPLR